MRRTISMAVYGLGFIAVCTLPTAAEEYRGQYWYAKYFDASERHVDRAAENREALPHGEMQIRAFDQGFYNAHHLHRAANRPVVFALAREDQYDNEVAIVIYEKSGDVIQAVVLPH